MNRLLYGGRDDLCAVLAGLGRRLEATSASDAVLLPVIVGTVREALRLSYAAIALPRGDGFAIATATGEAIFSAGIASRLIDFFTTARPVAPREVFPMLTAREQEMLHLVAQGASSSEIARLLSPTAKTVASYLSNSLTKLQAGDREEAMLRVREAGLGQDAPEACAADCH